jgi:Tim44-like domain
MRAASTVGQAASATWDSPVVKTSRKVVSSTASTVAKGVSSATEPIRQHEIYKSVSASVGEAIDDGNASRYGGYRSREERRELRQQWEAKQRSRRVEANPDAGANVVLHKDSTWKEQWDQFKEGNTAYQSLLGFKRQHFDESENPIVSGVRNATDWLADTWSGVFSETEVATVVRRFKEIDPNFNIDLFNTELREWIIPEIVDAYVKGDVETLKLWFSEAVHTFVQSMLTVAIVGLASGVEALPDVGTATRWPSPRYPQRRHHNSKTHPTNRLARLRCLLPHTGNTRVQRHQNQRSQSRCRRSHPTGPPQHARI